MKWLIGLVAVLGAGLTLAGCALTAKDIPYPTLEAKYGGPASRYMDLPGELRVHYRDQGKADGPAVVLVLGGWLLGAYAGGRVAISIGKQEWVDERAVPATHAVTAREPPLRSWAA